MGFPVSYQTLRRLLYFEAIAQARSINGAASRLGLSKPVLSEALSTLEDELGVSLAVRSTRKFELTEDGIKVRRKVERILEIATDIGKIGIGEQRLGGAITITLPAELAVFWLPRRLKGFHQRHPDVTIHVHSSDQIENIRVSVIELALRTSFHSRTPTTDTMIVMPLAIVASPELADVPFDRIPLLEHAHIGGEGRSIFGTGFSRIVRVNNRNAAIAMAREGLGAVRVVRAGVASEISDGTLVDLMPGTDIGALEVRPVFRDRHPSVLASAFWTYCRNAG